MVTVGVYVRARASELDLVRGRLDAMSQITTFELEDPGTIGMVLQAADLDAAYTRLRCEVEQVKGVLAAWPIHTVLQPWGDEGRSREGEV